MLLRLPAELVLEIMEWLPPATFFALAYTCRRCYQVVSHEPNLHYARLYRWRFPSWRTEHALLAYWRDTCALSDWKQLYHRRCRLEMAWRHGHWQHHTHPLPGRDDMTARSLLVNANMGATVAVRAGGHLVHVALPQPPASAAASHAMSTRIMTHASYAHIMERVAHDARGSVELRANAHYLLVLVHHQGRIGVMDATLWCVRSLRFLARIPMSSMSCRLMGRHIIRVHTMTGKTSIVEAVMDPSTMEAASTSASAVASSPMQQQHSNGSSGSSSTAPGVHLIRHQLPKLGWNWDVVTVDTTCDDIWLIAGGGEKAHPDHCSWAILRMAPTPSHETCLSMHASTTTTAAAKPRSLKAQILRQGTLRLRATTIHVLEAQLEDQCLLLTGSANPHANWHYTSSSTTSTTSSASASSATGTRHYMSDVLVDAEAMTTAELTATEAYRWLHVCSIDGRRAWRRHFALGCVRGVRLHAGLDRVCVHLAHKKLCVLRASDGALLGEMDFYGGALLYHVLGPICVSVDEGRGGGGSGNSVRGRTTTATRHWPSSPPPRYVDVDGGEARTTAVHHASTVIDDRRYTQRLIVYDLVRVRIMGMYPLPVDQAGMPGGSFSFAVSPVQLALRDARSSLMTSVVFDKPSL